MNNKTVFEVICVITGGLAGFLFGAADGLFYALVTFVVMDYITGVVNAIINKRLSSRTGFEGLFRKIMVFILVALANIIGNLRKPRFAPSISYKLKIIA
ncbi:MAG: phage holin family protein, partial [Oscillospiraceae bacterium]|nr:phage holin family protein [Oscillospiraceae bacterium]